MSATCLKTSPAPFHSPPSPGSPFPALPSFSLHTRIYGEEGEARSFDSTAFLPIRQTFDSFTWEPRNSSRWLPSSSLGPLPPRSSVRYAWFPTPSILLLDTSPSRRLLLFADTSDTPSPALSRSVIPTLPRYRIRSRANYRLVLAALHDSRGIFLENGALTARAKADETTTPRRTKPVIAE